MTTDSWFWIGEDNDGNITFRISFGNATSTDSKYNRMAPSPAFVDVINMDDYED